MNKPQQISKASKAHPTVIITIGSFVREKPKKL